MPTFRPFLRQGAVFILIFVLSIPLVEIVFRMVDGSPGEELRGLFTPFEQSNYKMAAMVDTNARYAWGMTEVYTDALGLRCDKERRFGTKPGGRLNALFLGDSQMFGSGLNYEETLPGRIAQVGAREGLRIADAGINGHSVIDQLKTVKW